MRKDNWKPSQEDRHQEFDYKRLVNAALACCMVLLAIYASLVYQRHVREDIDREIDAKMMAGDPAMVGNVSVAGGANLDSDGSETYAGRSMPVDAQEVFDSVTVTIECLDKHDGDLLATFTCNGLVPGEYYIIEASKIDCRMPTVREIRGQVPREDFTVTFEYFVPPTPIPSPKPTLPTDEAAKAQTQLETPARIPIKHDEDTGKEMPYKAQTPPVNSSVKYNEDTGRADGSQMEGAQTYEETPTRSDYRYQDPAGNIHAP